MVVWRADQAGLGGGGQKPIRVKSAPSAEREGEGISLRADRAVLLIAVVAAWMLVLAAGPAMAATPEPYGSGDFGGFRNILPPGENGFANATDYANFFGQSAY